MKKIIFGISLILCTINCLHAQKQIAPQSAEYTAPPDRPVSSSECGSAFFQAWDIAYKKHKELCARYPKYTTDQVIAFNKEYKQIWQVEFPNLYERAKKIVEECEKKQRIARENAKQTQQRQEQTTTNSQAQRQQKINSNKKWREEREAKKEQDRRKGAQQAEQRQQAFLEMKRKKLEAERKKRERRINTIAKPAQQNIDDFTKAASNAAFVSEARGRELADKSLLAKHNAQNQGRNISVESQMPSVYAMEMMNEEIPCINIGQYGGQDVCKKGDTIIVAANNKKYLLSRQTLMGAGDGVYSFIPANAFIIAKDMQGGEIPIGYITTTSQKSNSTLYGENERFAESAVGCRFTEFICDKGTYDKFIQFCNWQICKMENTANVFRLSYSDYEKMIEEDIALNNKIIMLNVQDIITSISKSLMSDLTKGVFDPETSLRDVTMQSMANFAATRKITGPAGRCVNTAFNTVEKAFNLQYKDLTTITVKDIVENQKIRDLYKTEFQKSVEDAYHTFFDLLDDCNPNVSKILIAYQILPELVNVGMILAANTTIKYSVSKEYKESLKTHIEKAKNKKQFIEIYKKEYQTLIEKNQNNCLEYTRIINKLKSEINSPFGNEYSQEELTLMKEYVLGKKEITQCNVLNPTNLKSDVSYSQPTNNSTLNKRGRKEWLEKVDNMSDNTLKAQEKNTKTLADMAGLADCAYSENDGEPDGYENISTSKEYASIILDANTRVIQDKDGKGFHCELFYNKNTGKYVLSFRGSDITPFKNMYDTKNDVWTDVKGNFTANEGQTQLAIDVTGKIIKELEKSGIPPEKLQLTGHSLGGRLAAEAAIEHDLMAYTFNAADVSLETRKKNELNHKGSIINTVSSNDPLSNSTFGLGNTKGGINHNWSSSTYSPGYTNVINEADGGHSISALRENIKQRHTDIRNKIVERKSSQTEEFAPSEESQNTFFIPKRNN